MYYARLCRISVLTLFATGASVQGLLPLSLWVPRSSFGLSQLTLTSPTRLDATSISAARSSSSRERHVSVVKPMGLVLEELDEGTGVQIVEMESGGAAAQLADLCIHDQIVAVHGKNCREATLEQVMEWIGQAPSPVDLTVARPRDTVAVRFQSSGIGISAPPGAHLCNLALVCHNDILYSCRNGSCGTCEQVIVDDKGDARYIRPCVGRVPKNCESILVAPSDRYEG